MGIQDMQSKKSKKRSLLTLNRPKEKKNVNYLIKSDDVGEGMI